MNGNAITEISQESCARLLSTGTVGSYAPAGLFYHQDGEKFIGIDNSTGNAWVEEFDSLEECTSWLLRQEGDTE